MRFGGRVAHDLAADDPGQSKGASATGLGPDAATTSCGRDENPCPVGEQNARAALQPRLPAHGPPSRSLEYDVRGKRQTDDDEPGDDHSVLGQFDLSMILTIRAPRARLRPCLTAHAIDPATQISLPSRL
jgi:hypothetical protein